MSLKTPQAVLSARDLRVSFRSFDTWNTVVKGISFDIRRNETVAVVGESGSGKSVTALSVMRLLDRDASRIEGRLAFEDKQLLELSEGSLRSLRGREISMIFQEPMTSLNPILTIGRQITEVLVKHKGMSQQAAELEAVRVLEKVRIPAAKSRLSHYPHQFSGGMRQRVMIASAIACGPKLLIADEPTTALDVTIQAQIIDLIKDIQAEDGMSVMFITHDMGVVAEIADRTIVMFRGDIVEEGDTRDIFVKQKHPYTRNLLSVVPELGAMKDADRPRRLTIVDPVTGEVCTPQDSNKPVPSGDTVLEVRNLTVRFDSRGGLFNRVVGRVHAVEDVSLSLRKGETLSLVGESGSGKSTAGRAVLQLIPALSGQVLLDGEEVSLLSSKAFLPKRRKIQMIFQDPMASLDPRVAIGQTIAEPILVHKLAGRKEALRKAGDLLEKVGLGGHMLDRYPHELSGGQRQRVCIARALSLDPKVIVADEAVSALDVSVRAQVINLMMDLQDQLDIAYLFISHDMAVVERISHRVAVMYRGEIVEIGARNRIFSDPQHPYTKQLLAAVPVPDPARRAERRRRLVAEMRDPYHPVGYVPPVRSYRQSGEDHYVQEWGDEWASLPVEVAR